MSNERREPKGIPTGGRFAPNGTKSDITDLNTIRGDDRLEDMLPDWPDDKEDGLSEKRYATPDGGTIRAERQRFYDENLGYARYEKVEYRSADGLEQVTMRAGRYEGEPPRDPMTMTLDDLHGLAARGRRALARRFGVTPKTVRVDADPNPRTGFTAHGEWEPIPEPEGLHPIRARRVRRENERLRLAATDFVEVYADGSVHWTEIHWNRGKILRSHHGMRAEGLHS